MSLVPAASASTAANSGFKVPPPAFASAGKETGVCRVCQKKLEPNASSADARIHHHIRIKMVCCKEIVHRGCFKDPCPLSCGKPKPGPVADAPTKVETALETVADAIDFTVATGHSQHKDGKIRVDLSHVLDTYAMDGKLLGAGGLKATLNQYVHAPTGLKMDHLYSLNKIGAPGIMRLLATAYQNVGDREIDSDKLRGLAEAEEFLFPSPPAAAATAASTSATPDFKTADPRNDPRVRTEISEFTTRLKQVYDRANRPGYLDWESFLTFLNKGFFPISLELSELTKFLNALNITAEDVRGMDEALKDVKWSSEEHKELITEFVTAQKLALGVKEVVKLNLAFAH